MNQQVSSKADAVRAAMAQLGADLTPADGVNWIKQHYPVLAIDAKTFSVYKSKERSKGTTNGTVAPKKAPIQTAVAVAGTTDGFQDVKFAEIDAARQFVKTVGGYQRAAHILAAYGRLVS